MPTTSVYLPFPIRLFIVDDQPYLCAKDIGVWLPNKSTGIRKMLPPIDTTIYDRLLSITPRGLLITLNRTIYRADPISTESRLVSIHTQYIKRTMYAEQLDFMSDPVLAGANLFL